MRKCFYRISTFLVLFLTVVPTFVYLTFPIYPWSERLTNQNGIFLLAKTVKENLKGLNYYGGTVYYQNLKVGKFNQISLMRFPLPSLLWKCEGGEAKAVPKWGYLDLHFKSFECIYYTKDVEGDIKLYRREIFGKLTLKGVKVVGLPIEVIDRVEFTFKGKEFNLLAFVGTQQITGKGTVDFDLLNLQSAKIEATFSGGGFNFRLRGNLFNPQVVW